MFWKKILIVLFAICFLYGCQKEDTNVMKEADREEQTLWQLLDSEGKPEKYLSDEDKNVKAVRTIVEEHHKLVDNRSGQSLNCQEEFKLYAPDFKGQLEVNQYEEALNKMYKDNQMAIEAGNLTWFVSTFNEAVSTCKVTIDADFKITKCNQEYLDTNELDLNTEYVEQRIIYLEKEKGEWFITNITKSAINKKEKM